MAASRLIRTPDGYRRFTPDGAPLYDDDDRDYQRVPSGVARDATRWWHATLYRSRQGRYAVHLIHRTRWQGEQESRVWLVAESGAELASRLHERGLIPEWVDEIVESIPEDDLAGLPEV